MSVPLQARVYLAALADQFGDGVYEVVDFLLARDSAAAWWAEEH